MHLLIISNVGFQKSEGQKLSCNQSKRKRKDEVKTTVNNNANDSILTSTTNQQPKRLPTYPLSQIQDMQQLSNTISIMLKDLPGNVKPNLTSDESLVIS